MKIFTNSKLSLSTAYKPLQIPVESIVYKLVEFDIGAKEISKIIWSSYCFYDHSATATWVYLFTM